MGKQYVEPRLTPIQQSAVTNGEFDFLLPLAKNLWRPDEVADAIGRSPQFVRQLAEEGLLEAHIPAGRIRNHSLITRRSVVLYLADTANYDPAFFIIRLESVIKKLPAASLDRLIETAKALRNQIR